VSNIAANRSSIDSDSTRKRRALTWICSTGGASENRLERPEGSKAGFVDSPSL
jgi:hypothetical protein